MRYEESVSISTPEGVAIDLALAGIGSRFVAGLVDGLIKGVAILILFLATVTLSSVTEGGGALMAALVAIIIFLITIAYDILFEVLASGRTPGKRMNGLRVVRDNGQPVTFVASSVRNLMRLVDILPFGYMVGAVSVLATARNQRLGDLAAGTMVVRDRRGRHETPWAMPPSPVPSHVLQTWDVSAISGEEVAAARAFLARRYDLTWEARRQLGEDLSTALRARVAGGHSHLGPEDFLAALVAAKAART